MEYKSTEQRSKLTMGINNLFKKCNHKWEVIERSLDSWGFVTLVLVCNECGKIKKIKV